MRLDPPRERLFNLPPVVVTVVAVLVAIQAAAEWVLTDAQFDWVLAHFAFVPAQFTRVFDPAGVGRALLVGHSADSAERAVLAHLFLGPDVATPWWTPLTYGLLHGNWPHVGLNCLWLVAFGSPVAVRFGPWRFILFMLVTSVFGAAAHYGLHRFDIAPVIGASAAVSGVVGAAARFAFEPGIFLAQRLRRPPVEVYRQPAVPLSGLWRGRTLWFLLLWQVINVGTGLFAQPLGLSDSPIAWEAHIGGMLAGLLLFGVFDPVRFTNRDLPPFVPELADEPEPRRDARA